MVNDRGHLGLLVALCSLAGVAVGFGLSNMAVGLHANQCHMGNAAPAAAVHVVTTTVEQGIQTPTWLGVRIRNAPAGGAVVETVESNSPAHRAGIREGDVITGFSESCRRPLMQVQTSSDLVRFVRSSNAGSHSVVIVERDGQKRRVRAKLERMPRSVYEAVYQRQR
jgi:S1-C subfamily serine protease